MNPLSVLRPRRDVAVRSLAAGLALAMTLTAGCTGGSSRNETKAPAKESAATKDAATWDSFGAPISDAAPLAVADVLAAPESFAGRELVVEGTVAEVCQAKGCWLTMQSGDATMRVHFKDYGFFVPKDCSGRTARLEGVLSIEMTSVEDARHYLEDAGKHEEALAITEPVPSLTFMASGVRLKA